MKPLHVVVIGLVLAATVTLLELQSRPTTVERIVPTIPVGVQSDSRFSFQDEGGGRTWRFDMQTGKACLMLSPRWSKDDEQSACAVK